MKAVVRRAFAGTLALCFLAGGVAHAAGAHHCPHHDALRTGADAAPAHSAPDHSAPDHSRGGHSGSASDHGPCTCMGQCHTGSVSGIPATSGPSTAAADDGLPSPPRPAPPARPAFVPFVLPWANAPPVS